MEPCKVIQEVHWERGDRWNLAGSPYPWGTAASLWAGKTVLEREDPRRCYQGCCQLCHQGAAETLK